MLKCYASGGSGKTSVGRSQDSMGTSRHNRTNRPSALSFTVRPRGRGVVPVPATRSWRVYNLTKQYGTQRALEIAVQQGILRRP